MVVGLGKLRQKDHLSEEFGTSLSNKASPSSMIIASSMIIGKSIKLFFESIVDMYSKQINGFTQDIYQLHNSRLMRLG